MRDLVKYAKNQHMGPAGSCTCVSEAPAVPSAVPAELRVGARQPRWLKKVWNSV